MVAGAGLPVDLTHFAMGRLAGASWRGAAAGAVRLQAACGEPDDVGSCPSAVISAIAEVVTTTSSA